MSQIGIVVEGVGPITPVEFIQGNTGAPVGPDGTSTIHLLTANTTVQFAGNPATFTITQDFGLSNLIIGSNGAITSGSRNVGLGLGSVAAVTSGSDNVGVGKGTLNAVTTTSSNTALGSLALNLTTGANNTALGEGALNTLRLGNSNVAVGLLSLGSLATGNNNLALGTGSGSSYTGSESNNVLLRNAGVLAENNTMRLGTTGVGAGQVSKTFLAGTNGVVVGNQLMVVIDSLSEQLGTAAIPIGTLTQLSGNTGIALPVGGNINIKTANSTVIFAAAGSTLTQDFNQNNLVFGSTLPALAGGQKNIGVGFNVLQSLTSGSGNVALGYAVLSTLTTGSFNTGIGQEVLNTLLSGSSNIGIGHHALFTNSTGSNNVAIGGDSMGFATGSSNTAVGVEALNDLLAGTDNAAFGFSAGFTLTSGSNNTALGFQALGNCTTASNNIAIGSNAAANYVTNESSNIIIGNAGVVTESNVIRLGTTGAGGGQQNKAFLAATNGVVVANQLMVVMNSATEQLGTAAIPSGTITSVQTANATPQFVLAGTTETVDFNLTTNLILGSTLPALAGGFNNVGVGKLTQNAMSTGSNNSSLGYNSMLLTSGGGNNAVVGSLALSTNTNGSNNVAVGADSLLNLATGSSNTCVGFQSGQSYTTNETNNLILSNVGTIGDSGVIRIGTSSVQTTAFITGINGNTVANTKLVTINSATDQLGVTSLSPSSLFPWSVITASQTAAVNNGYFINSVGSMNLALPAVSAVGDVIEVVVVSAGSTLVFTQAAGQQIFVATSSTSLGGGGTLTNNKIGDSIKLVCRTANTIWWASTGTIGSWTTA